MPKYNLIGIVLLILISFSCSQKLNRLNKKGQRTGRWVTYYDKENTIKQFNGRYKNGVEKGQSLYYSSDGTLYKKEISRNGKIKSEFYYPNGKVSHSGTAQIDNLEDRVHYYFEGTWNYYDTTGNLLKYAYFKKGVMINSKYVDLSNKTNDSLMNCLNVLERNFTTKNKDLLDSLAYVWWNPSRSEKMRNRIYQQDSLPFLEIETLLGIYGYPEREVCHESASIPFFIISHAPLAMREKYLELFKAAAGVGRIEKKTVAFYIDKVKLGKGEKQIYGTQYYYDKSYNQIYYPTIDPENVNKRREEVGLEPQ